MEKRIKNRKDFNLFALAFIIAYKGIAWFESNIEQTFFENGWSDAELDQLRNDGELAIELFPNGQMLE